MKSKEIGIDKFQGLSPEPAPPRNAAICQELLNMKVFEGKLRSVNIPFILSNSLFDTEVWPFPQFMQTNSFVFVGGATWIGLLDLVSSTITKTITGLTTGGRWKLADYTGFVVFTNGKVSVNFSAHTDAFSIDTDVPAALGLLNFNGQCIALGVTI